MIKSPKHLFIMLGKDGISYDKTTTFASLT